jgi:pimeloyl-ACP methyl ester carboxylesterase
VSIADHAEALDQFLSARNISNPVLIGHSMGTEIVVTLARDHPERSNRLVLLAPTMDPNARRFWQAAGRLLHDVFVAEHPAVAFIATIDYFRTGVPYFLKQTKHLLADRIEDSLTRISAPTLVLRGDRDVVSPLEWCEAVTSLLPQGTFVPVKGPHVMWYSDPDRVTELILEHANG